MIFSAALYYSYDVKQFCTSVDSCQLKFLRLVALPPSTQNNVRSRRNLYFLLSNIPLVNAQNADITFKSSNGFLFHIHRKNVEANTGGFAPPGLETYDEAVQLTEEASTLDLLFSFIYPKCQPTLVSISFITLARLAEAVEKYEVYSAMNICQIHMQYVRRPSIFRAHLRTPLVSETTFQSTLLRL